MKIITDYANSYEEFKLSNTAGIKRVLCEAGFLLPSAVLLLKRMDQPLSMMETGVIHFDPHLMGSNKGKDTVTEMIAWSIEISAKRLGLATVAVSFCSETWVSMTEYNGDKPPSLQEVKKLAASGSIKKREGIVITYDTELKSEVEMYYLKRMGKRVNSSSQLIDNIVLEECKMEGGEFTGRFCHLLKKATHKTPSEN